MSLVKGTGRNGSRTIECEEGQRELDAREYAKEQEVQALQSLEHLDAVCSSSLPRCLGGSICFAIRSTLGRAVHDWLLRDSFATGLRKSDDKEDRLQCKQD